MSGADVARDGNYAVGHAESPNAPVEPTDGYLTSGLYGPMGGAWVSAEDLAKFGRALMTGGGSMLSAASVLAMTTSHIRTASGGDEFGYGVFLDRYLTRETWSHTGSVGGFLTSIRLVPELGFGVFLVWNADWYWR